MEEINNTQFKQFTQSENYYPLDSSTDTKSKTAKFFESVQKSLENFMDTPVNIGSIVPFALDAVTSLITTPFSCLTGGRVKFINQLARKSHNSNLIFANLFIGLMSILSPGINRNEYYRFLQKNPEGLFTTLIVKSLFEQAVKFRTSNLCKKYFVSRIYFAIGGLLSIITRIADAAIGLVAILLAGITLARFDGLNMLALESLVTFPGVFHDVLTGIRGFINPFQSHLLNNTNTKNYIEIQEEELFYESEDEIEEF